MYKYHQHSEAFQFSGKIVCKTCGHCFIRRQSQRNKDKVEYYWSCKKYREGKYKKTTLLDCINGMRIKDSMPEEIFVKYWDRLVKNKEWKDSAEPKDKLQEYRLKELIMFVE